MFPFVSSQVDIRVRLFAIMFVKFLRGDNVALNPLRGCVPLRARDQVVVCIVDCFVQCASTHQCDMFGHTQEAEQLFQEIYSKRATFAQPTCHSIIGNQLGLFVDVGAVEPFTRSAFARNQVRAMEGHRFRPIWTKLEVLEDIRGVVGDVHVCSWTISITRILHDGSPLKFEPPVLDDDPSRPEGANVPFLLGLHQLDSFNEYFNNRICQFHCVLEGPAVS